MENKSGIKSATKTAIYGLDEDSIVAFIGLTQGDIANLDATKENYWETKSNLQQNIIWAWERFSQLRTAEYLGFGKRDKRETGEGKDFDLVEILKDCPSDTRLYSPLFGEVELVYVKKEYWYYLQSAEETREAAVADMQERLENMIIDEKTIKQNSK